MKWQIFPHERDYLGYQLCQRCRCRIPETDGAVWLCDPCAEIIDRELLAAVS